VGPPKSIALGFSATTILVWTCNITCLISAHNSWLATFGVVAVLLCLSAVVSLWLNKKTRTQTPSVPDERWRSMLFALQGAALACWIFDLATTYYAIDVTRVAWEVNPLGWPLGMLGALAYYGPTLTLSYILLFRIKEKIAVYAAVPVTFVALCMGLMNLNAGTLNIAIFTGTASVAAEVGYGLLALIIVAGFTFPRLITRQQQSGAISHKTL
jgi:hypothetical protein